MFNIERKKENMSLSIWMKLKPQKYRKMFTVGGKLTFSFGIPKLFDDL